VIVGRGRQVGDVDGVEETVDRACCGQEVEGERVTCGEEVGSEGDIEDTAECGIPGDGEQIEGSGGGDLDVEDAACRLRVVAVDAQCSR